MIYAKCGNTYARRPYVKSGNEIFLHFFKHFSLVTQVFSLLSRDNGQLSVCSDILFVHVNPKYLNLYQYMTYPSDIITGIYLSIVRVRATSIHLFIYLFR